MGPRGSRPATFPDLPAGGRPVRLLWRTRPLAVFPSECEHGSWSKVHPESVRALRFTEGPSVGVLPGVVRYRRSLGGADLGVDWHTVMDTAESLASLSSPSLDGGCYCPGVRRTGSDIVPQRWVSMTSMPVGRSTSSSGARVRGRAGRPMAWADPPGARELRSSSSISISLAHQGFSEVRQRTQRQVTGQRGPRGRLPVRDPSSPAARPRTAHRPATGRTATALYKRDGDSSPYPSDFVPMGRDNRPFSLDLTKERVSGR